MLRRSLPLDLIEKCELRAGHMFHLLPERPHAVEISLARNVRVLLLRHRLCNSKKPLLRPTQCAANAPRNALRNVLLLRQRGRRNENQPGENNKSGELHSYLQLDGISTSNLSLAHRMPLPTEHSTNYLRSSPTSAHKLTGPCPLKYRCLSTGPGSLWSGAS